MPIPFNIVYRKTFIYGARLYVSYEYDNPMPRIQQPPWGFLMHAGTKRRHNWRAWKPKSPFDYLDLREPSHSWKAKVNLCLPHYSLRPSSRLMMLMRVLCWLCICMYLWVLHKFNELCQCMPMHCLHIPRLLLGDHTSAQKCRLLLQASRSVTGMPLCFVLHHLPCEMNKLRWTRLNSPAMSSTSFNFYIANELAVWRSGGQQGSNYSRRG